VIFKDESQDEAMPEDPGAELSGRYDFSAKKHVLKVSSFCKTTG
jgi:hypothetical protein